MYVLYTECLGWAFSGHPSRWDYPGRPLWWRVGANGTNSVGSTSTSISIFVLLVLAVVVWVSVGATSLGVQEHWIERVLRLELEHVIYPDWKRYWTLAKAGLQPGALSDTRPVASKVWGLYVGFQIVWVLHIHVVQNVWVASAFPDSWTAVRMLWFSICLIRNALKSGRPRPKWHHRRQTLVIQSQREIYRLSWFVGIFGPSRSISSSTSSPTSKAATGMLKLLLQFWELNSSIPVLALSQRCVSQMLRISRKG